MSIKANVVLEQIRLARRHAQSAAVSLEAERFEATTVAISDAVYVLGFLANYIEIVLETEAHCGEV